MLRPTAYLAFYLAQNDAVPEVASAIKRAYSYIAPTKILREVDQGNDEAAQAQSKLALEVRIPAHPFMAEGDPQADKTWEETILPWLKTKLDTLFGSVREFNNEERKSFVRKVDFASFELTLESRVFEFNLEPNSQLRDFEAPLRKIRSWLAGAGTEAGNITHVVIPSDAERGDADWFDVVLEDGTTQRIA